MMAHEAKALIVPNIYKSRSSALRSPSDYSLSSVRYGKSSQSHIVPSYSLLHSALIIVIRVILSNQVLF